MSSVPLKLKDSADFQELTSVEENYLAYQVGKELVYGDSSTPGSLSLYSSGNKVNIGQFSDFSFDSAVATGGSPGTLFSGTTINTQLYQNDGTVIPSDSDDRLPILQRDSDGQRVIREMNDSDMNVLLDRLNSRIHTSEYVGSYRLGNVPPDSAEWTEALSDVTTDTRTDGTSIQYNIYQKTSQTPPTTTRPFSIKRSNGKTGSYQGLQLMTDRQIQKSLGVRAKNRIASNLDSSGVGSYIVQTSIQGTPSNLGYVGTWSARGVATDTRQALVDANYTRSRQSTYSRLRSSAFSFDYVGNYVGAYTRVRSIDQPKQSTQVFSKTRVSNYSLGFVGNFVGNYTTNRSSTFTVNRASVLDFTNNSSRSFLGNYSRLLSFTGNYIGNYVGNYVGTGTFTSSVGTSTWFNSSGYPVLNGSQSQPYTTSSFTVDNVNYTVQALGGTSGFTSGTTNGTSLSILKHEVLSITTQPVSAAFVAYSLDTLEPAEKKAISTLEKSNSSISSTTPCLPANSNSMPLERLLATK